MKRTGISGGCKRVQTKNFLFPNSNFTIQFPLVEIILIVFNFFFMFYFILLRIPDGFTQLLNLTHVYLNDAFLDRLPSNFGR